MSSPNGINTSRSQSLFSELSASDAIKTPPGRYSASKMSSSDAMKTQAQSPISEMSASDMIKSFQEPSSTSESTSNSMTSSDAKTSAPETSSPGDIKALASSLANDVEAVYQQYMEKEKCSFQAHQALVTCLRHRLEPIFNDAEAGGLLARYLANDLEATIRRHAEEDMAAVPSPFVHPNRWWIIVWQIVKRVVAANQHNPYGLPALLYLVIGFGSIAATIYQAIRLGQTIRDVGELAIKLFVMFTATTLFLFPPMLANQRSYWREARP